MNAHAELFMQIPATARVLPDPIGQMKLFELIQIIPSPTKSAIRSGNLLDYRISDPRVMRISSRLGTSTARGRLRPSAKFLMRCGFSMGYLNERWQNSMKSRRNENRVLSMPPPQAGKVSDCFNRQSSSWGGNRFPSRRRARGRGRERPLGAHEIARGPATELLRCYFPDD